MHYGVRNASEAGLGNRIGEEARDRVSIYHEDRDGRMDFTSILSDQPLGTHAYICGPRAMLEAALRSARACGWPDSHIHSELFDQQTTGQPFEVSLARSGITLSIPPELSLLEAAEAAGVAIPYLCRGGACGQCETEILDMEGELVHRDIWLSDADKLAGKKIMPCVSRANCTKLILNA
jgi:ferredoxin